MFGNKCWKGGIFLGWLKVGGTCNMLGEKRHTYKMFAGKFCVTKLLGDINL
jgi:hypothetical protein